MRADFIDLDSENGIDAAPLCSGPLSSKGPSPDGPFAFSAGCRLQFVPLQPFHRNMLMGLRTDLQKQGWNGRSAVYRDSPPDRSDHGSPDLQSVGIQVSSEQSDAILGKLPGIGAVRVQNLKAYRPSSSLDEVLAARIGVGCVNAEKWKLGIRKKTIGFD